MKDYFILKVTQIESKRFENMKVDGRRKVDVFKSEQSFVGSSILVIWAWKTNQIKSLRPSTLTHDRPFSFNLTFDTSFYTWPSESLKIQFFQKFLLTLNVDCQKNSTFRRIDVVDRSIFSVNQLFRIMESMYDSTKGTCNAMGVLELERTFNFKRWKLSYLFSHSDKVWIIEWLILWRHRIFVIRSLLGTVPSSS